MTGELLGSNLKWFDLGGRYNDKLLVISGHNSVKSTFLEMNAYGRKYSKFRTFKKNCMNANVNLW